MKRITSDELRARIKIREERGDNVDTNLKKMVETPGMVFISTILKEKADFLSLIWMSNEKTNVIAPKEEPRTLTDVVRRLNLDWKSLKELAEKHPWFKRCLPIERNFDHGRLDFFAIRQPNAHESKMSPEGTFHMMDGNHRVSPRLCEETVGRS